jgi:hypothetical protein
MAGKLGERGEKENSNLENLRTSGAESEQE